MDKVVLLFAATSFIAIFISIGAVFLTNGIKGRSWGYWGASICFAGALLIVLGAIIAYTRLGSDKDTGRNLMGESVVAPIPAAGSQGGFQSPPAPPKACPSLTASSVGVPGSLIQLSEFCAFARQGSAATITATCPPEWICTFFLASRQVVVVVGPFNQANVGDGTWRFVAAYPLNDAVHDPCALLKKERATVGAAVMVRAVNFPTPCVDA
jgi:hypothetical protein